MDAKISAPTRLEEILAEWNMDDNSTSGLYESAQDTITLSSLNNTLSNVTIGSPYTVTGITGTNFPNAIYTTGTGTSISAPWATFNPNSTSARINLTGDEADIEVNGWSLVQAVKRIEERLGLFQPNPELESEWEELRELGEQYRALEQHIKDKQATWDRLKAMPAPEVD
jgi:hypothetical protein